MVDERNKNGKFKSIIDFMNRVSKEVINKRQLEKLIQAGAFDSIEANRSKLFNNVPKFVELFGGEKNINMAACSSTNESRNCSGTSYRGNSCNKVWSCTRKYC